MNQNFIILTFILSFTIIIINNNRPTYNKEKLTIILPIRDREHHLNKMLPALTKLLNYQKLNYNIIIIEQSIGKSFNKGKLNNSGFIEAVKRYSPKHVLFSDIDNIPLYKNSYRIELFNELIFNHYYGYSNVLNGVFSCSVNTFYKMNGFSNKYWGWGQEDDDINRRAIIMDIPVNRDNLLQITSYNRIERSKQALNMKMLDIDDADPREDDKKKHTHTNYINYNRDLYKDKIEGYTKNKYNILGDGINQCSYKILSTKYLSKYNAIRIIVDL